jgi:hypothetical protein
MATPRRRPRQPRPTLARGSRRGLGGGGGRVTCPSSIALWARVHASRKARSSPTYSIALRALPRPGSSRRRSTSALVQGQAGSDGTNCQGAPNGMVSAPPPVFRPPKPASERSVRPGHFALESSRPWVSSCSVKPWFRRALVTSSCARGRSDCRTARSPLRRPACVACARAKTASLCARNLRKAALRAFDGHWRSQGNKKRSRKRKRLDPGRLARRPRADCNPKSPIADQTSEGVRLGRRRSPRLLRRNG